MYVLGFNAYLHDSAACIVKDGEVLAFAEEERFNRKKHTHEFPQGAVQFCLDFAGIDFSEVSHVGFFWNPYKEILYKWLPFFRFLPYSLSLFKRDAAINPLMRRIASMLGAKRHLNMLFDGRKSEALPQFHFVDHHISHAASCYLVSPFDEAAIFVADGYAEHDSTLMAHGRGGEIEKLETVKFPVSLGQLYGAVTEYLGFRICDGEGKVMALASFGEPRYEDLFDRIVLPTSNGQYKFDFSYLGYQHYGLLKTVSDKFISETAPIRKRESELPQVYMDVAASLQQCLEKHYFRMLNVLYERTKCPNLCLAGGMVLNSVANGKILEKTPFENVFIQPAANDAGSSLGSAMFLYHKFASNPQRVPLNHAYGGPSFTDEQVEAALKRSSLAYRRSTAVEIKTAKLIADGNIVGWFQGRMEFGPRALGNRSILADPRKAEMKDILNQRVKHRESFRPFAPSIKEEKLSEFFESNAPEPYMLKVYRIRPEKLGLIPAAAHVDGTGRVQSVSQDVNPRYYKLIDEFEKLTGVPVVVNTSFNVRGEPIVCTPQDAINCFANTHMDYLVMGDFIARKRA